MSQAALAWLEKRLRELRPEHAHKDFGGLHVLLMGDFRQTDPVRARSLFDKTPIQRKRKDKADIKEGQRLYDSFSSVIDLKTNYRIKNAKDDPEAAAFLRRQLRWGDGECSAKEDYVYWNKFMASNNRARANEFKRSEKTTNLTYTNRHADDLNSEYVKDMATREEKPIFAWMSHDDGRKAELAKPQDVWGLCKYIALCEGTPVVVLVNLYQEAGVTNGAQGTFIGAMWKKDAPMLSVPEFVVVDLPCYNGPPFPGWGKDHPTWVPIRSFTAGVKNNRRQTRTQIPIVVSRALTTYKAQGMSLEQVYAYLKDQRLTFGLDYTTISRPTHPDGLIIEDFDASLLDKVAKQPKMLAKNAHMRYLLGKVQTDTQRWTNKLTEDMQTTKTLFNRYYQDRHSHHNPIPQQNINVVDITLDVVDDVCDSSNWFGDTSNAAIADHTFEQQSAWRRRNWKNTTNADGSSKVETWQVYTAPLAGTHRRRRARQPHKNRALCLHHLKWSAYVSGFTIADMRLTKDALAQKLLREKGITARIAIQNAHKDNPFAWRKDVVDEEIRRKGWELMREQKMSKISKQMFIAQKIIDDEKQEEQAESQSSQPTT